MVLTILYTLHWFAALIIAMQAIDKIFQCPLRQKNICAKARLSMALKGFAWMLMALAAFGVLPAPLFRDVQLSGVSGLLINPAPSVAEIFLFVGFAVLVLRSWVNEAIRCKLSKTDPDCPLKAPKNPVNSQGVQA